MSSRDSIDDFALFALSLALLALAFWLFVIGWALLYVLALAISGAVFLARYAYYRRLAEQQYDQLEAELGIGIDPDTVLNMVFGEDPNRTWGSSNFVDWYVDAVLNTQDENPDA